MKSEKKNHGPSLFIKKLYRMLTLGKNESILSWTDSGTGFLIKDIHLFSETILPQYFKHKNLSSFIRMLNMYDFHKSSEKLFEFTHPLFAQNTPGLLNQIKRKSPESSNTKDVVEGLSSRLQTIQTQQALMENMLESLEKQYSFIAEQNQRLIQEILKRKQREMEISKLLEKLQCKKALLTRERFQLPEKLSDITDLDL